MNIPKWTFVPEVGKMYEMLDGGEMVPIFVVKVYEREINHSTKLETTRVLMMDYLLFDRVESIAVEAVKTQRLQLRELSK